MKAVLRKLRMLHLTSKYLLTTNGKKAIEAVRWALGLNKQPERKDRYLYLAPIDMDNSISLSGRELWFILTFQTKFSNWLADKQVEVQTAVTQEWTAVPYMICCFYLFIYFAFILVRKEKCSNLAYLSTICF